MDVQENIFGFWKFHLLDIFQKLGLLDAMLSPEFEAVKIVRMEESTLTVELWFSHTDLLFCSWLNFHIFWQSRNYKKSWSLLPVIDLKRRIRTNQIWNVNSRFLQNLKNKPVWHILKRKKRVWNLLLWLHIFRPLHLYFFSPLENPNLSLLSNPLPTKPKIKLAA